MDNKSVKNNITRIRRAAGLSQGDMAERLGLSRTAYRNLEKGDTQLINGKVEQIAGILETSAEELVLGYSPSEKDSGRLKDEFLAEKTELISEYEKEIARLRNHIATLTEHIELLKDSNRTKDEIISMLKKKLAEISGKE